MSWARRLSARPSVRNDSECGRVHYLPAQLEGVLPSLALADGPDLDGEAPLGHAASSSACNSSRSLRRTRRCSFGSRRARSPTSVPPAVPGGASDPELIQHGGQRKQFIGGCRCATVGQGAPPPGRAAGLTGRCRRNRRNLRAWLLTRDVVVGLLDAAESWGCAAEIRVSWALRAVGSSTRPFVRRFRCFLRRLARRGAEDAALLVSAPAVGFLLWLRFVWPDGGARGCTCGHVSPSRTGGG